MELVQNGESSKSPSRHMTGNMPSSPRMNGSGPSLEERMSRLIMPTWQGTYHHRFQLMIVPPPKHVHASHNFVELLSLQSQYEDYVRPYFSPASADDGAGAGAAGEGPNKKRKLDVRKFDKGYQGLLDDCIGMLWHLATLMLDPVPNLAADMKNGNRELLSLISDIHGPVNPLGRVMPDIWDRPIEMLPGQAFAAATLEVGSKVTGVRL
jgi:hypothetical protein